MGIHSIRGLKECPGPPRAEQLQREEGVPRTQNREARSLKSQTCVSTPALNDAFRAKARYHAQSLRDAGFTAQDAKSNKTRWVIRSFRL